MSFKRIKYIILLISILPIELFAQPSESGFSAAIYYNLPTTDIPVVQLPYLDNNELKLKDTCKSCGESYGVDANMAFDFWERSSLNMIDNGIDKVEIYRVKVKSPTAKALHVIFKHFELGSNSQMFIYSPLDTKRILGAYSEHNNKPDFSFISNVIFGGEIIIEVDRRPKKLNESKGVLLIYKFIHVYKDRAEFEASLNCHENVICAPWYNDWCNQIRSVVKFLRHRSNDGWYLCSGAVVNNLANNFEPYVLTAYHCVNLGDDNANWMVWFNFQSNTCSPTNNGNDLMTVSGVDVVATDDDYGSCPDMALMKIRSPIPLQYNPFFSGWNRRAWSELPDDGEAVGIHHPAGDVKKFSKGERSRSSVTSCIYANWSTGYTEAGSSGSPMFISRKEIIGVLSWGWHSEDDCEDDADFYYSWLKNSWDAMKSHLAPGNESALTLDGSDPISACQNTIDLNHRFFPGRDWQIKNQITIQAAQQINVANNAPTSIEQSPFNSPAFNSDYIITAGKRITISPQFRINTSDRISGTGLYTGAYTFGSQNKVRFQIKPCTPYIDECGVNHENALVKKETPSKNNRKRKLEKTEMFKFDFLVFPNPTNGNTEVKITSYEKMFKVYLTDMYGNKLINYELSDNINKELSVALNHIAKGIYFISVEGENGEKSTKKLIIN